MRTLTLYIEIQTIFCHSFLDFLHPRQNMSGRHFYWIISNCKASSLVANHQQIVFNYITMTHCVRMCHVPNEEIL